MVMQTMEVFTMMGLNVLNRECELRDGHKSVLVSGNQKFLEYALRRVRLALWDSPSVSHEGLRVYDCIRWDYEFVSVAPVYPVKKFCPLVRRRLQLVRNTYSLQVIQIYWDSRKICQMYL